MAKDNQQFTYLCKYKYTFPKQITLIFIGNNYFFYSCINGIPFTEGWSLWFNFRCALYGWDPVLCARLRVEKENYIWWKTISLWLVASEGKVLLEEYSIYLPVHFNLSRTYTFDILLLRRSTKEQNISLKFVFHLRESWESTLNLCTFMDMLMPQVIVTPHHFYEKRKTNFINDIQRHHCAHICIKFLLVQRCIARTLTQFKDFSKI